MTISQTALMTPEQIRVAVAERLGWKKDYPCVDWREEPDMAWRSPRGTGPLDEEYIPNFPECLNACAEFEKTLGSYDDAQRVVYQLKLERICGNDFWEHKTHWSPNPINASALQRCRAFLAVTENRNE